MGRGNYRGRGATFGGTGNPRSGGGARGGGNVGGPLVTNHLRDLDIEMQLLQRKRQIFEQEQNLLDRFASNTSNYTSGGSNQYSGGSNQYSGGSNQYSGGSNQYSGGSNQYSGNSIINSNSYSNNSNKRQYDNKQSINAYNQPGTNEQFTFSAIAASYQPSSQAEPSNFETQGVKRQAYASVWQNESHSPPKRLNAPQNINPWQNPNNRRAEFGAVNQQPKNFSAQSRALMAQKPGIGQRIKNKYNPPPERKNFKPNKVTKPNQKPVTKAHVFRPSVETNPWQNPNDRRAEFRAVNQNPPQPKNFSAQTRALMAQKPGIIGQRMKNKYNPPPERKHFKPNKVTKPNQKPVTKAHVFRPSVETKKLIEETNKLIEHTNKLVGQSPKPRGQNPTQKVQNFSSKVNSPPKSQNPARNTVPKQIKKNFDPNNILLPNRNPSVQVKGRLELALGTIMKSIKELCPDTGTLEYFNIPFIQRVIKHTLRVRIRNVMMNEPVENVKYIVDKYREKYPQETDIELMKIAQDACEYNANHRPVLHLEEADDPEEFYRKNMGKILYNKLQDVFTDLHKLYENKYSNIEELVKNLPELSEKNNKDETQVNKHEEKDTCGEIAMSGEKHTNTEEKMDMSGDTDMSVGTGGEKDTDGDKAKDGENVADGEKTTNDEKDTDSGKGKDADGEKDEPNINTKYTDSGKDKDADGEKDEPNINTKDTDSGKDKDADGEKDDPNINTNDTECSSEDPKIIVEQLFQQKQMSERSKNYVEFVERVIEMRLPFMLQKFKEEFMSILCLDKEFTSMKALVVLGLKKKLRESLETEDVIFIDDEDETSCTEKPATPVKLPTAINSNASGAVTAEKSKAIIGKPATTPAKPAAAAAPATTPAKSPAGVAISGATPAKSPATAAKPTTPATTPKPVETGTKPAAATTTPAKPAATAAKPAATTTPANPTIAAGKPATPAPATPAKAGEKTVPSTPKTPASKDMLYVKLIGRPALPARAVIYEFLEKFSPASIKKHKSINNLLVIAFTDKEGFEKILAANESVVGDSTIIIKAQEQVNTPVQNKTPQQGNQIGQQANKTPTQNKVSEQNKTINQENKAQESEQNKTNNQENKAQESAQNDKTPAQKETSKDITGAKSTNAENIQDSSTDEIMNSDLESQISDLLSSIRKADEEEKEGENESKSEEKMDTINIDDDEVGESIQKESDQNKETVEEINKVNAKSTTDDSKTETIDLDTITEGENEPKSEEKMDTINIDDDEVGESIQKESDQNKETVEEINKVDAKSTTGDSKTETIDLDTIMEVDDETKKPEDVKAKAVEEVAKTAKESGRATPTRSSSRLANVTPSTIKTRRASRLANNN